MVESSQNVNLILEALLAICRFKSRLLLECFHSHVLAIQDSLGEVHACEVTLSDFLNAFIVLVKSFALHYFDQELLPRVKVHK